MAELTFRPVTPERWGDLERLFGPHGACDGCWCMWWRLKRSEFARQHGQANRRALKAIVEAGRVPGILAYRGAEPVGWCSVAPREEFPVLDRSPTLKRVDDRPVWSIVCFYAAPSERGRGISRSLIEAAVEHARRGGAQAVEAYPLDPQAAKAFVLEAFTGVESTFHNAGFSEVARRSPRRSIVRRYL